MRRHSRRAGVDLLRPFLTVHPAHLAAICRARRLATEQDPSNADGGLNVCGSAVSLPD